MKLYKKIDLYMNGKYICSTNRYKTCKGYINSILGKNEINVAGIGIIKLDAMTDIKARFSK